MWFCISGDLVKAEVVCEIISQMGTVSIERWLKEGGKTGATKNGVCSKTFRARKPQGVLDENEVGTFKFIWNDTINEVER